MQQGQPTWFVFIMAVVHVSKSLYSHCLVPRRRIKAVCLLFTALLLIIIMVITLNNGNYIKNDDDNDNNDDDELDKVHFR